MYTYSKTLILTIILALIAVSAIAAPPQTINIRGQLLDADGHGLPGARDYSVQFYDAASGGNALGAAISGVAEVSIEGLFNIEVIPPPQALLAPQAWYEVAISSSPVPGPLGAGDVFPDRVKMQSVPFALESSNAAHVEVSAIGAGTILDTEFGFLSGLTANIQDQLDAKANAADVYTKTEVDDNLNDALGPVYDEISNRVSKAGDTMTGPLEMASAPAPGTVTDKLYNVGGALQWNGNPAYRFPWTVVTADTQMDANNGYIANAASLLTLTLPISASINIGDTVRVSGVGIGGWKIAQNAAQSILAGALPIPGSVGPWTPHESLRTWKALASSSDGAKLVACDQIGYIYTSTDTGVTWTPRVESMGGWEGIASSDDGAKLVACDMFSIYTSADSGATWTDRFAPMESWTAIASSSDGAKLAACAYNGSIYTSADSGATWTPHATSQYWQDVASSSDGVKLVACSGVPSGGSIFTSTDSGATWASHGSSQYWISVASSSDGTKLVACVYNGQIYTSTDSGLTWIARDTARSWNSVASSADGTRLVACVNYGGIYVSTDSGVTWAANPNTFSPDGLWTDVASSADGTKLVACSAWGYGGRIYTYDSKNTTTTLGTTGYISGGQNTAIELQYIGNDIFMPLSYVGSLGAN
ncbi:MAG TPA: hypothetical protein PLI09_17995 [Candidatus Hydrogenedentes bacterium]|nr:hypothetical protein [Candidatus Hydrogenedentota bacterium]